MKIISSSTSSRSAFATAAVFILLLAASALTLTAAGVFRNLHRELRFTDQKQVDHWKQIRVTGTEGTNAARTRLTGQTTNSVPAKPQP